MTTITDGLETITPILWMDYKSSRPSNTIVHKLADGGTALTVRESGNRECNLVLLFGDEDESARCEAMLARKGVQQIIDPGRPTHSMSYAVTGNVTRELDTETARIWFVTAEVIEVTQ